MKLDGSNPIRLTNNPAIDSNPQWSSDGKTIFFQSNRDGNYEIFRINIDGSGFLQLTSNEADDFLSP
jgi:TolB protein